MGVVTQNNHLKQNTVVVINNKTRTKSIWDSHLIFTSSQHEYELNEQLAVELLT